MRVRCGAICPALASIALLGLGACGSDETASETRSEASNSTTTAAGEPLRLVAIGDSIPYNSPQDCPGCTGFVDRYAESVESATDRPVEVENLSEHNNLTLSRLLDELDRFRTTLAAADVIVVGIAHNSIELNADRPCGKPLTNELPDWSAMTRDCALRTTRAARPQYDRLYSEIASLREGKPTILRTINRYNDFIGWAEGNLTPAQERTTAMFVEHWDAMLCESAAASGFGCADLAESFNGPDGMRPAGDLLAADYTHPSDKGNERIAQMLADLGFEPLA